MHQTSEIPFLIHLHIRVFERQLGERGELVSLVHVQLAVLYLQYSCSG